MYEISMMTMEDAELLVKEHTMLCKNKPSDRSILDSAMVQTLGEALQKNKTTPELVAYVIKNIFDEEGNRRREAMRENPMLAIANILYALSSENEE